jgi:hypothetical protein
MSETHEKSWACLHCVISDAVAEWAEKHYGPGVPPDGVKILAAVGKVASELLDQIPAEARGVCWRYSRRRSRKDAGSMRSPFPSPPTRRPRGRDQALMDTTSGAYTEAASAAKAAKRLAAMLKDELGAEVDPDQLRKFVATRFHRLSLLAHTIHNEADPSARAVFSDISV